MTAKATPMTLNSPEALHGRELAVCQVEGIRWRVVATLPGVSGRMADSRVRLRSIPNGTLSEVEWAELRVRLIAGVLVVR